MACRYSVGHLLELPVKQVRTGPYLEGSALVSPSDTTTTEGLDVLFGPTLSSSYVSLNVLY